MQHVVSAWNIVYAGIAGLFSFSSCSCLLDNCNSYFCISQTWDWAVAGACRIVSNVMHYVLLKMVVVAVLSLANRR